MADAYLINGSVTSADMAQVVKILNTHGYSLITKIPSHGTGINPAVDIGIVLLPIDPTDASNVDSSVKIFFANGIRVIAIWLNSTAGLLLPTCITRMGYSAVCSASPHIGDALKGNRPVGEQSDCSPRSPQEIPRNRC